MTSQHSRSLKVTDINPHLLCVLCGGYYIDATTIIECLHSFCRSCIVRYLETNKYCPICDVQVHKTKPLLNIRPDRNLQAIVYKLVPGLFERELQNRKEFYKQLSSTKQANTGTATGLPGDCPIYAPDESILLKVGYANSSTSKVHDTRYFRCPVAITVYHLQKLMRAKFNLNACQKVDFIYDGDSLPDYLSLMDLAYMYHWKREYPVELEYRFLEYQKKKIKLSHDANQPDLVKDKNMVDCKKDSNKIEQAASQPDREVQLQISENGVISVQSVSLNEDTKPSSVLNQRLDDNNSTSEVSIPVKNIHPETMELMKSLEKTVNLNFEQPVVQNNEPEKREINNSFQPGNNHATIHILEESSKNIVNAKPSNVTPEKCVREEVTSKQTTKLNVNHMSPIDKLESAVSQGFSFNASGQAQKVYPGAVKDAQPSSKLFKSKDLRTDTKEQEKNGRSISEKEYTKPVNNIRYKTLKTTVKPWNPSIPRSSIMAMKQAQLANQEKPESQEKSVSKSPKFFKMRNLPRFLGNPASGVKPMYQVLPGSELNNQVPQTSTSQNTKQNSELTVMKIDPKTLSPIPVSRSKISSPNKVMTSHSGLSQKPSDGNIFSSRTPIHNSVGSSSSSSRTPMKKPHSPRLPSSPFILPPHTSHMLYSGFPRPFPSVDPTQSRMASDNQIFRAMSMLCSPSGAFHPSLPPSISMLFNPHHPHHRASQNEKINMKFTSGDFHKTTSSLTPSVQRVPPSCPASKHSLTTPYGSSSTTDSINNNQDSSTTKCGNEKHVKQKQEGKPTNVSSEEKSETVGQTAVPKRLTDLNSVPLSNGFNADLYKCTVDKNTCDKTKGDNNEKMVQNVDIIDQNINKEVKNDQFGKSNVNKSSVVLL